MAELLFGMSFVKVTRFMNHDSKNIER